MLIVPEPGEKLTNSELCDLFGCGTQGGMRRAHKTNSLVLISKHFNKIYGDRWIGNVLHYTGMGITGDQSLNFMQNRTLYHANQEGVNVYLFETYRKNEYVYTGQVYLAGPPYTETQRDPQGIQRKVFIFPLKIISPDETTILPEEHETLSDYDLELKAKRAIYKPATIETTILQYSRNQYVNEFAKRRAKGICQLCEQPAPFIKKDGAPYLETHHIIWLSQNGEDSIENTVALCPNCHRKMHSLNLEEDREKLIQTNNQ